MVIRGCIGDDIDHFRFDFVRLATARLGKGDAKSRQLPLRADTFGFMTLFLATRILQSPSRDKRKSVEKRDRCRREKG